MVVSSVATSSGRSRRSGQPRRTQAERRAATSAALLEATVDCLAHEGYAQTTMRRVAERAGVSPGALQHHFETKVELLGRTREHIGREFLREVTADPPSPSLPPRQRNEILLDRQWTFFCGPRSQAATELAIAARTDEELRARLRQAEEENAHLYVAGAAAIYPELAGPQFTQLAVTGLATLRGLAMLRLVNERAAELAWPSTRAHLLALFEQFVGHPEA